MYDDEPYDYGFDLPDKRYKFTDIFGVEVFIKINRHYFGWGDEMDWYPTFDIIYGDNITSLPKGIDQSKAIDIAHIMYKEDEEETAERDAYEAECERERRMGC